MFALRWKERLPVLLGVPKLPPVGLTSVKTHGILLIPKSSKLHDYTMYSETAAVAV